MADIVQEFNMAIQQAHQIKANTLLNSLVAGNLFAAQKTWEPDAGSCCEHLAIRHRGTYEITAILRTAALVSATSLGGEGVRPKPSATVRALST
jgi:hypothetical protein